MKLLLPLHSKEEVSNISCVAFSCVCVKNDELEKASDIDIEFSLRIGNKITI